MEREEIIMRSLQVTARHKLQMLLFLFICLTGCTHTWELSNIEPESYPEIDKLNMRVGLKLTAELLSAEYKWGGGVSDRFIIPLGEIMSMNAQRLAHSLFSSVTTIQDSSASSGEKVDLILTPRVVSVEASRPISGRQDAHTTIILEWTLTDMNGNLIWMKTFSERQSYPTRGEEFHGGNNTINSLKSIISALFNNSYQAMSTSKEIRDYANSINM
jgi:hypothetical protein